MRTQTYRTALLSTLLLAGCTPRETMPELTDRVFAVAAAQYEQLEGRLTDETLPRSVASDGKFIPSNIRWWCSGFYPGSLWYIYEYTGDKTFRELAEKNTFKLYPLKQKGTDHDLGFQMNCSFGNAYRITGEQKYLEPIHTSARVLAGRFSPVTGVIRSWDFVRKGRDWKYPVIIDNMMNLEHLYNAGLLFGDDTLKSVAVTHANTTLCNHFRPDFTSYHLVDYDPADGRVRRKETVQGFSDESAWARGQAWALYGYTMMFRLSGYECYLNQAENIAGMLLERLSRRRHSLLGLRLRPHSRRPARRFGRGDHGLGVRRLEFADQQAGGKGQIPENGRKATAHPRLRRLPRPSRRERELPAHAQRGVPSGQPRNRRAADLRGLLFPGSPAEIQPYNPNKT